MVMAGMRKGSRLIWKAFAWGMRRQRLGETLLMFKWKQPLKLKKAIHWIKKGVFYYI